jgi:hypothetical protein
MAGFTENSRLANERMIGNNVTLKGIIAVNDGKRECGTRVLNCYDEQAPILFDKYTKVSLSTEECDICSTRSRFIILRSAAYF